MSQWMLAIRSLVPLPFLNLACTSWSSQFMYCWPLVWRNLSITLLNSMWNEQNCMVVGMFFGIVFFGIGMKTDLFQFCGLCWVFHICWHIEHNTFTASFFRIWKNSAGVSLPPLTLFVVMFPKARLTSHSRMSDVILLKFRSGHFTLLFKGLLFF